MGGCRCSYPNCTVKSDGVTHMFHYPVFDRVRCHQWLVNTNRLEFLNLKVSQLKNRVICQHHFKDSYFMNFKKEKLKFDAVPTESGPFCDSKHSVAESTIPEEITKVYDISLDDIENEVICYEDKKANFSVKYGNFLTNCDLISELDTSDNIHKNNAKEAGNIKDVGGMNEITDNVQLSVITVPCVFDEVKPKLLSIEFEDVNPHEQKQQNIPIVGAKIQTTNNTPNINNEKKIRIISEKKILSPILTTGKFKPVSPALVIRPNNKQKVKSKLNNGDILLTRNVQNDSNASIVKEVTKICSENNKNQITEILEQTPLVSNLSENNSTVTSHNTITGSQLSSVENRKENKVSLLSRNIATKGIIQNSEVNVKNKLRQDKQVSFSPQKIPPARVAAIDKKRKFNMKLRDIIESCLDKIDDNEKLNEESQAIHKIEERINNKAPNISFSKEKEISEQDIQNYPLALLEARIKTMEDNLLNKIDQNSQKIVDLKNSFLPVTKNIIASTNTFSDENSHKKYLYQEISKYLSSEANSLIYEELFINKLVQKVPKGASPLKRRRCR